MSARAQAFTEAADLLAAEARWQYELHTRHHVGAQIVAQRMQMQERILRTWAVEAEAAATATDARALTDEKGGAA